MRKAPVLVILSLLVLFASCSDEASSQYKIWRCTRDEFSSAMNMFSSGGVFDSDVGELTDKLKNTSTIYVGDVFYSKNKKASINFRTSNAIDLKLTGYSKNGYIVHQWSNTQYPDKDGGSNIITWLYIVIENPKGEIATLEGRGDGKNSPTELYLNGIRIEGSVSSGSSRSDLCII